MLKLTALSLIALLETGVTAGAEGTVSTYLHDGWEIKGVTQLSTTGRTQIILVKDRSGIVCTIYYSVTENGWTPQGCELLP